MRGGLHGRPHTACWPLNTKLVLSPLSAYCLQELTGSKNIKLKPVVDADLVAGFVVEYGSTQIDLSGASFDQLFDQLDWFVGAGPRGGCSVVGYAATQIDLSGASFDQLL